MDRHKMPGEGEFGAPLHWQVLRVRVETSQLQFPPSPGKNRSWERMALTGEGIVPHETWWSVHLHNRALLIHPMYFERRLLGDVMRPSNAGSLCF